VNGGDSAGRPAYEERVKPLLALLSLLLLATSGPVVRQERFASCPFATPVEACLMVDLADVGLEGAGATLIGNVEVDPRALPLSRPLMVWVIALASSEVSWNGVVIGRNGIPGPDAASETPGRFVSTFVVPAALVRPGRNQLSVRMSAHHLWLPVRTPVHRIDVASYETPDLPGLSDYLPALLSLGALAAALIYFGTAAWSDRRDRQPRLLAGIAGAAILQLGAEVIRVFVAYSYPWHLARVTAVALLAAVAAVLIAAYAARRFAPAWRKKAAAATALAALASLLLLPWYDLKALGAILAGAAALGLCAGAGLRARRPGAIAGLAAALAVVAIMAWQRTAFLDQAYYLLVAALLVALVAEQVASLRRARAERDSETRRAGALAERLARAEREGEAIVALKDGTRTRRVAESDIIFVRAADDYCEAVLADGRILLVTTTLARFLATLPDRFVRVHKSYAVNRPHVASIAPRPGGGRLLAMSDGAVVPVGRAYAEAVVRLRSSPSDG
jgi:DNA-binding LytR/AlgR family response regulator